jgi:hypothetical protein
MKNDSHALLRVSLPHGKSVQCQLQVGGQMLNAAGPPTAKLRPLEEDFERVFSSSRFEDVRKLVSLASTFAQTALPVVVAEALRQWASNHTEPVFLAVCCEAPQLVRLPWELIPLAWRAENLQVVRIPDHGKSVEPAAAKTTLAAHRLLAVGWPDLPNLKLPGIERELAQLPRQLQDPRLNVSILMGPTFSEFAKCYRDSDASILHLATPGIIHEAEQSYLVMAEPRDKKTGTPGSTPTRKAGSLPGTDLIEISEICQVLVEHSGLRLIVLNTCHGGLGVAGTLSRACGLATIGWAGFVADDLAADFALYFYQRLLEGKSAAESIYSFVHRFQVNEESVQACLPIVWLPTVESIGQRLLEPLESLQPPEFNVKVTENSAVRSNAFTDDFLRTTSVGKTPKPFDFSTGPIVVAPSGQACIPPSWPPPSESDECVQEPLQVQIDLEPALTISPALLKNGRPAIKRLSLLSNQPVAGLRLEVFCDAGFGTSVFRRVQSLKRGSQPIQDNIQFPVLFELSDRRWGRRRINFTATARRSLRKRPGPRCGWDITNGWIAKTPGRSFHHLSFPTRTPCERFSTRRSWSCERSALPRTSSWATSARTLTRWTCKCGPSFKRCATSRWTISIPRRPPFIYPRSKVFVPAASWSASRRKSCNTNVEPATTWLWWWLPAPNTLVSTRWSCCAADTRFAGIGGIPRITSCFGRMSSSSGRAGPVSLATSG